MLSAQEKQLAQKVTTCIRLIAAEGVEQAKSGHPGLPLGAADLAYVLWQRHLRFNPADPTWINRDRFVLSAGHGSMLLYTLLHLYGYDLPVEELKRFRQWESRTPGHPEHGLTPGVETSTGPLGAGISTAVGMAIASEMARARLAANGHSPIDCTVYVLAGDGDMMEGVSGEACSLAGHLRLSNLIVLYDDNHITIEGDTSLAFSENVGMRYEAYGWKVLRVDGHDYDAVDDALTQARAADRPTLIICRTTIAKGACTKEGSHHAHGAPLGAQEIAAMKQKFGFAADTCFCATEEVRAHTRRRVQENQAYYAEWRQSFDAYLAAHPAARQVWDEMQHPRAVDPAEVLAGVPFDKPIATRAASGAVLQYLAKRIPALVGGSADLAPSNNTNLKDAGDFSAENRTGRNLHFGVREHAMGHIVNGMALSGVCLPFGATFFVFSDYLRPAVRLSALMRLHVVWIFTHDTIFVGEDGPTHQPVEHLWALRAIPDLNVIRPADATETAVAWSMATSTTDRPTALILTRQNLPVLDRKLYAPAEQAARGGYVISEARDPRNIQYLIIATGSEVHLALAVQKELQAEGSSVRVVSMPCLEVFQRQEAAYQDAVLPPSAVNRISIEAGTTTGWYRYIGREGLAIGIDRFGASAPAEVLAEKFGLTPTAVIAAIKRHFTR